MFLEKMRGIRLGTEYGSPYLFNRLYSFPSGDREHGRKYNVAALAVDDRLLLRNQVAVPVASGRRNLSVYEVLKFRDVHQCPQMREIFPRTPHNFERQIKAATSYNKDLDGGIKHLQGFTFSTHRCTLCPTQVNIEVTPVLLHPSRTFSRREKPYVLSVKFYTDFGKCQTPDEME
jgi:hypothetical protein